MIDKPVGIIIPTYNNFPQLSQMVNSVIAMTNKSLFNLYIINNGHPDLAKHYDVSHYGKIINMEKNVGWEGGLEAGLKASTEPFVLFANDDIFFPQNHPTWMSQMLSLFDDPTVGAIGPMSNCVMGQQNVFFGDFTHSVKMVKLLIGFCFLARRSAVEQVGGIDTSCPGGDDLDLSIRLRKANYKLLVTRSVYVHHHGFQTGQRVHGSYWNSNTMSEKTNNWLMRKHGVKWFHDTIINTIEPYTNNDKYYSNLRSPETDMVASYVVDRPVLELGCGATKTVPDAVGMDIVAKGEWVDQIQEASVADIRGDVTGVLPVEPGTYGTVIARHILEHCVDTIQTLKEWMKPLKDGGRLIIAVPNEDLKKTIPLNPEHVHAFTPESLKTLGELVGLKCVEVHDTGNGISFVIVFYKKPTIHVSEVVHENGVLHVVAY